MSRRHTSENSEGGFSGKRGVRALGSPTPEELAQHTSMTEIPALKHTPKPRRRSFEEVAFEEAEKNKPAPEKLDVPSSSAFEDEVIPSNLYTKLNSIEVEAGKFATELKTLQTENSTEKFNDELAKFNATYKAYVALNKETFDKINGSASVIGENITQLRELFEGLKTSHKILTELAGKTDASPEAGTDAVPHERADSLTSISQQEVKQIDGMLAQADRILKLRTSRRNVLGKVTDKEARERSASYAESRKSIAALKRKLKSLREGGSKNTEAALAEIKDIRKQLAAHLTAFRADFPVEQKDVQQDLENNSEVKPTLDDLNAAAPVRHNKYTMEANSDYSVNNIIASIDADIDMLKKHLDLDFPNTHTPPHESPDAESKEVDAIYESIFKISEKLELLREIDTESWKEGHKNLLDSVKKFIAQYEQMNETKPSEVAIEKLRTLLGEVENNYQLLEKLADEGAESPEDNIENSETTTEQSQHEEGFASPEDIDEMMKYVDALLFDANLQIEKAEELSEGITNSLANSSAVNSETDYVDKIDAVNKVTKAQNFYDSLRLFRDRLSQFTGDKPKKLSNENRDHFSMKLSEIRESFDDVAPLKISDNQVPETSEMVASAVRSEALDPANEVSAESEAVKEALRRSSVKIADLSKRYEILPRFIDKNATDPVTLSKKEELEYVKKRLDEERVLYDTLLSGNNGASLEKERKKTVTEKILGSLKGVVDAWRGKSNAEDLSEGGIKKTYLSLRGIFKKPNTSPRARRTASRVALTLAATLFPTIVDDADKLYQSLPYVSSEPTIPRSAGDASKGEQGVLSQSEVGGKSEKVTGIDNKPPQKNESPESYSYTVPQDGYVTQGIFDMWNSNPELIKIPSMTGRAFKRLLDEADEYIELSPERQTKMAKDMGLRSTKIDLVYPGEKINLRPFIDVVEMLANK